MPLETLAQRFAEKPVKTVSLTTLVHGGDKQSTVASLIEKRVRIFKPGQGRRHRAIRLLRDGGSFQHTDHLRALVAQDLGLEKRGDVMAFAGEPVERICAIGGGD